MGTQLAARHPDRVRSLSLHSAWATTDLHLKTILEMWRSLARGLPTVADAVIQGIFPLGFTHFVRSRPAQPLDAFLAQSAAVTAHDAGPVLGAITAPTLITFGGHDLVTSTRFADELTSGIAASEVVVFYHLSHAGLHEDADAFNRATLDFLLRQRG